MTQFHTGFYQGEHLSLDSFKKLVASSDKILLNKDTGAGLTHNALRTPHNIILTPSKAQVENKRQQEQQRRLDAYEVDVFYFHSGVDRSAKQWEVIEMHTKPLTIYMTYARFVMEWTDNTLAGHHFLRNAAEQYRLIVDEYHTLFTRDYLNAANPLERGGEGKEAHIILEASKTFDKALWASASTIKFKYLGSAFKDFTKISLKQPANDSEEHKNWQPKNTTPKASVYKAQNKEQIREYFRYRAELVAGKVRTRNKKYLTRSKIAPKGEDKKTLTASPDYVLFFTNDVDYYRGKYGLQQDWVDFHAGDIMKAKAEKYHEFELKDGFDYSKPIHICSSSFIEGVDFKPPNESAIVETIVHTEYNPFDDDTKHLERNALDLYQASGRNRNKLSKDFAVIHPLLTILTYCHNSKDGNVNGEAELKRQFEELEYEQAYANPVHRELQYQLLKGAFQLHCDIQSLPDINVWVWGEVPKGEDFLYKVQYPRGRDVDVKFVDGREVPKGKKVKSNYDVLFSSKEEAEKYSKEVGNPVEKISDTKHSLPNKTMQPKGWSAPPQKAHRFVNQVHYQQQKLEGGTGVIGTVIKQLPEAIKNDFFEAGGIDLKTLEVNLSAYLLNAFGGSVEDLTQANVDSDYKSTKERNKSRAEVLNKLSDLVIYHLEAHLPCNLLNINEKQFSAFMSSLEKVKVHQTINNSLSILYELPSFGYYSSNNMQHRNHIEAHRIALSGIAFAFIVAAQEASIGYTVTQEAKRRISEKKAPPYPDEEKKKEYEKAPYAVKLKMQKTYLQNKYRQACLFLAKGVLTDEAERSASEVVGGRLYNPLTALPKALREKLPLTIVEYDLSQFAPKAFVLWCEISGLEIGEMLSAEGDIYTNLSQGTNLTRDEAKELVNAVLNLWHNEGKEEHKRVDFDKRVKRMVGVLGVPEQTALIFSRCFANSGDWNNWYFDIEAKLIQDLKEQVDQPSARLHDALLVIPIHNQLAEVTPPTVYGKAFQIGSKLISRSKWYKPIEEQEKPSEPTIEQLIDQLTDPEDARRVWREAKKLGSPYLAAITAKLNELEHPRNGMQEWIKKFTRPWDDGFTGFLSTNEGF